jgi:UV DNA damage endonuclease
MLRFGLCCAFRDQPIKFRTTTAAALARLSPWDAAAKLSRIALDNGEALFAAVKYCAGAGIGCFRINSQFLPLKTHPRLAYRLDALPDAAALVARLEAVRQFAAQAGIRLTFHPDQFVVLNSRRPEVVEASLAEIEYQAEVARLVGADVVNIHAGGAFGDKAVALDALARSLDRLSPVARPLVTIENDDKVYSPAELIPFCVSQGVPFVYDIHHHRCLPDGLSVEHATAAAVATWNREPLMHVSSPLDGWNGPRPERHHDFIDAGDFPSGWRNLNATVEIEAKAKEVAVQRLMRELGES